MSDDEIKLTPRQEAFLKSNPGSEIAPSPSTPVFQRGELVGVGGWLGFLAASLVALGPMLTLGMTASEISELKSLYPSAVGSSQWQNAVTVSWAAAIAYCSISIFAGYRLIKHHVWITVPIVIVCIWLAGPGVGIFTLMAMQDMSGGQISGADAGATLGRPLVSSTIWTLYLLLSKRVKNTYPKKPGSVSNLASLKDLNRETRKFVFFSGCWVVTTVFYFSAISADGFSDRDGPNGWAIVLLPPILFGIAVWAYRRFVGSDKA